MSLDSFCACFYILFLRVSGQWKEDLIQMFYKFDSKVCFSKEIKILSMQLIIDTPAFTARFEAFLTSLCEFVIHIHCLFSSWEKKRFFFPLCKKNVNVKLQKTQLSMTVHQQKKKKYNWKSHTQTNRLIYQDLYIHLKAEAIKLCKKRDKKYLKKVKLKLLHWQKLPNEFSW